jgi:hypothetical protein
MARWGFWDWVAYVCLGVAAFGLAGDAALKDHPQLFQHVPAFFLRPFWGYVPIILFALGSAILAVRAVGSLLETSRSDVPPPSSAISESVFKPSQKIPKEQIFVDVTPQFLVELKRGRTTAEGATLLHPYIGKWMKLSGPISDVSPPDLSGRPSAVISFNEPNQRISVLMFFDKNLWERISTLRVDQNILVQGQISTVESSILLLVDCEIVQVN